MKFIRNLLAVLAALALPAAPVLAATNTQMGPALGAGGVVLSPVISALGIALTTATAFTPSAQIIKPEAGIYVVIFDSPGAGASTAAGVDFLYPDGVTWSKLSSTPTVAVTAGGSATIVVQGPLWGIRADPGPHVTSGTINAYIIAL